MSTVVSWNSVSYTVPATGEENWGGTSKVDGLLVSLATNGFNKAGGTFTLASDAYFGATAGLKSLYYKSADGTVSAPGFTFTSDLDCGMYRIGTNNIGLSVNGTKALDIGTAGVASVGYLSSGQQVYASDGSFSVPAFSFTADTDSGIYRLGANNIGIACNGAKVLDIGTAGLTVVGAFVTPGITTTSLSNVGVGTGTGSATATSNILSVGGTGLATSAQVGIQLNPGFRAAATGSAAAMVISAYSEAASYTIPYYIGVFPQDITKGAGSAITRSIMYYMVDPAAGTNNAVFSDNVLFTGNYFFNYTGSRASRMGSGNFVIGNGALATGATDGFLYIPTTTGTPTGDSTDYTGSLPMVYDTGANKLWINTSGTTWKFVALT